MGTLLSRCCGENNQTVVEGTDSDQTEVYQDLSSHLYRVLDVVGVSEEVREGYREYATAFEVLLTAECRLTMSTVDTVKSQYIFGSKYEGTTTKGIDSDIDFLICIEDRLVVENIDDAPVDSPAFLMLSGDTKPGYVKLQSVVNRMEQTINEREITYIEETDHGRLVLKHFKRQLPNAQRHGPAFSTPSGKGIGERDLVYAIRCRTIPSFADEWLHRPRPYQWPSQEQLKRMGSYGCFFVGVAHPASQKKENEWRISFSLQERDLMTSLNSTQHKCYVLLKMIKKDIIQPRVGQSISSYHCKTCIFHLAESRAVDQWTPNNLVSCILECLRLILDWVRQEHCPNYFIKDENMFDKLDKSTLIKLSDVIHEFLSDGVKFLYEINCDDIGFLLTLRKSDKRIQMKKLIVRQYQKVKFYVGLMLNLLDARTRIYRFIDNAPTHQERGFRANDILQYLENTAVITEHKHIDVRMALDRLIPYIRFVIVQMKCSNELVQIKREKYIKKNIQDLEREIRLCKHCDLISAKLLVASLFLQIGKLDRCQDILDKCATRLKPYVTSTCHCYNHQRRENVAVLGDKLVAENLSFGTFRREYPLACIIFLPSEANLVPAALRYEMYRSVYTPPGSRNDRAEYWFDWIVVDSLVYLFFLKYVLYAKLDKITYRQIVIDTIQHIAVADPNLGHRETALNLLGWIYMQENRVQDAFGCFRRSLALRPLHNSAKWHLLMLIHSEIDTKTNSYR